MVWLFLRKVSGIQKEIQLTQKTKYMDIFNSFSQIFGV